MATPSLADIARYFLRLGALGFGGPIALAGYMERDLVQRRGWFTRDEYLQGLAVAQTLPGPLAAQLAMWLGHVRGGAAGAIVAGLAFILPPFFIVSVVAAAYVATENTSFVQALFYGIGPAVIAIILRGAQRLLRISVGGDRRLWAISAAVGVVTFAYRAEIALLFVAAGLVGVLLYVPGIARRVRRVPAVVPAGLGLIGAVPASDPDILTQLGVFFFKAGAFTFGSGLAIVPFLQEGVVHEHGWLTQGQFLDAVAMGMITPGPVVITAVFIGYLVAGLPGATVAGIGVFLPPLLMVVLFAPLIQRYRTHPAVVGFSKGATAAAGGAIVGAAAVIATNVLTDVATVVIFVIALAVLLRFRLPEPAIVAAAGVAGLALWAVR